ncbi:MAG: efflux RND transporter permease subunit, partial [Chloroflexi bacterium]
GQAENSSNASSSQMQVDVSASDPGALRDANASVMIALAKVHGVANLKSNLVASKPQYQLVPTDRLAASGLTVQQLALIVAQDVNGVVATQAVLPQGPVSVRVVLPPGTADTAASLAKIPIPTLAGVVPLSSLATIQLVNGPQAVSRLNGDRDATITGTITGNNTQAVQSDVSKALNGVALPSGVKISTGGVFQQLSTVLNQFALALLAAIALVYLIMVATFRSVIKPLVLLVSIPFAATGAIIALVITRSRARPPGRAGRGRPPPTASDPDDRVRHHARVAAAGGHGRRRRRRWRLHQWTARHRRHRRTVHQHAADAGPRPRPLLADLPFHRPAHDAGPRPPAGRRGRSAFQALGATRDVRACACSTAGSCAGARCQGVHRGNEDRARGRNTWRPVCAREVARGRLSTHIRRGLAPGAGRGANGGGRNRSGRRCASGEECHQARAGQGLQAV